jgi:Astacin (Peptidase family M12A)
MNNQRMSFTLVIALLLVTVFLIPAAYAQDGSTQPVVGATVTPESPTQQPSDGVTETGEVPLLETPTSQDFTDPTEPYPYELFEGDIQMPVGFHQQLNNPGRMSAWSTNAQLWSNGFVPYRFALNVTSAQQQIAMAAMNQWASTANIRFVPRTNEDDYITFQSHVDINDSWVGRRGGEQIINIADWQTIIVAHELAHALGMWHEQSRPDRDRYIFVNYFAIVGREAHNFDVHDDAYQYGPYDFDSVMHYEQCDFSIARDGCPTNGFQTILVREPYSADWQSRIGQRDHLSYLDKLTMSFVYPQPSWRFLDGSRGFGFGTFIAPFNQFIFAYVSTPANGTLWIQPGTYTTNQALSQPIILKAPLGGVTITGN